MIWRGYKSEWDEAALQVGLAEHTREGGIAQVRSSGSEGKKLHQCEQICPTEIFIAAFWEAAANKVEENETYNFL